MFGLFKKKKEEVSMIPKKGDVLQIDKMEFMTINQNTKFKFESEGVKIVETGKYSIMGLKFLNLYFRDIVDTNLKGYIQIKLDEKDKAEECKIFINYDTIYPSSTDEWNDWLGTEYDRGIMCDDIFIIEDEGEEVEYPSVYENKKPVKYNEYLSNGVTLEKQFSLFSRNLENEFINEEFVSVIMAETEEEAYIAINIGVLVNPKILGFEI